MPAKPAPRKHRPFTVRRNRHPEAPPPIDDVELQSLVGSLFCRGLAIRKIHETVAKEHSWLDLRRTDLYPLLHDAAKLGRFRYRDLAHEAGSRDLLHRHHWLRGVRVVRTTVGTAVAQAAAESLLELVKKVVRSRNSRTVHIGFYGGHTMRALAREFGDLFRAATDDLPQHLVIHSLVAGFDPKDPSTDPQSFTQYFRGESRNEVKVEFHRLTAPPLVHPEGFRVLRDLPFIKEAFEAARDVDIVVTSGSCWNDPDSALRKFMEQSPACHDALVAAKVIGDVGWRPIGVGGPICIETKVRALTLFELSDLPALIHDEKRVLMTLGPCGLCNTPKDGLLACLMNQEQPLMTDLVVDSRTWGRYLEGCPQA